MKAIFLKKYGKADQAFEIRETEIPTAGQGELVIKVQSTGINFADIVARRGMYPDAPKNPAVLGYDVTGTIHQVGTGVAGFELGQRVVALTRFGGYAEYALTKKEAVAVLPEGYDMNRATALATQACTAYYCAEDVVSLHKGDCVLIQAAAGGVGSILVQIAKHRGCKIIGTASSKKQAHLTSIGVDLAIDYTKEDFASIIKRELGDKSVDVVFDSLGGQVFKKSKKLLRPTGKIVLYGAAEQMKSVKNKLKLIGLATGFGLSSPISLLMESQAIIAVNMLRVADHRPDIFEHTMKQVVTLAEKGIINPRLDRVFKVDKIAEAHQYIEDRKSMGKVALSW